MAPGSESANKVRKYGCAYDSPLGLIVSGIAMVALFLAMPPHLCPGNRPRHRQDTRLAPPRRDRGVVVFFGALGASFDALENVCLLLTLGGAGAAFPLLATVFATCRFTLLTLAIAYLIAVLATRLLRGAAPASAS